MLEIGHALETIGTENGGLRLSTAEQDAIAVVGMLFDEIRSDTSLALPTQHLMRRLQLSILEVALKDRRFLGSNAHPARRFVDELAHVGLGWDHGEKMTPESMLSRVGACVDEILRAPADVHQGELFATALARLRSIGEREAQRVAKIERRTTDKVLAEAHMAATQDAVRQELRQRLDRKGLPAQISAFLMADWQYVLRFTLLRWGKDSAEWSASLVTLDDLISSVEPSAVDAARDAWLAGLYKRMADALIMARGTAAESEGRIDAIRELHRRQTLASSGRLTRPALRPRRVRFWCVPRCRMMTDLQSTDPMRRASPQSPKRWCSSRLHALTIFLWERGWTTKTRDGRRSVDAN